MSVIPPSRVMKADEYSQQAAAGMYNFEDLQSRCESYLNNVRAQTKQLLTEAQQQAESIREAARAEGFELGKRQGLEEGRKSIQQQIQSESQQKTQTEINRLTPVVHEATRQIQQLQLELRNEWQHLLVHLSCGIAQRIVVTSLELNPERVLEMVAELLAMTVGETKLSIQLHPDDADLLGGQLDAAARGEQGGVSINMIPNEQLARGECLVENENTTIDARFETRFQRIAEELLA